MLAAENIASVHCRRAEATWRLEQGDKYAENGTDSLISCVRHGQFSAACSFGSL